MKPNGSISWSGKRSFLPLKSIKKKFKSEQDAVKSWMTGQSKIDADSAYTRSFLRAYKKGLWKPGQKVDKELRKSIKS